MAAACGSEGCTGDLSREDDVQRLVAAGLQAFGKIDALVSMNAAIRERLAGANIRRFPRALLSSVITCLPSPRVGRLTSRRQYSYASMHANHPEDANLLNTDTFQDVFVVKLAGTDGDEVWRREISGTSASFLPFFDDAANAVAVDGDGDVVAAGRLRNTDTSADFFVVKLAGDDRGGAVAPGHQRH